MGFRNLLGHTYDEVDHTAILAAPLIPTSQTPAYTVDVLIPAPTPKLSTPASRSAATSGTATPMPPPEPIPSTRTLTVPEVTTLFLSTLLASAIDFLGVKPTGCVISAPTWFTPAQHAALKSAAEAAGIKVLQVLDEAAAVLVGYRVGLNEERKERGLLGRPEEGDAGEVEPRDKKVVVLDMGETSLGVSVIAVSEGEYTVLGKGRDDKLGGREFDNLLLKHFAKEFTKKTKVPLELPCSESAPEADKRAEAKLRLAVEHTKRSLSASSGAATCAVESLKEGMDLSTAINRLRFDGLAAGVYRQVGAKLTSVVNECGLDLVQIDEILLAGASSLFPGLQQHLSLLVPPTTPVTSTLDPSQVIAIGCALQALHLSTLDEVSVGDVLRLADKPVDTLAKPIGVAVPDSDDLTVLIGSGAPLPSRRRVLIPNTAERVILELWEGKDDVKVTKVEREPVEGEDEEDEEEDEEIKTPITNKSAFLGHIELTGLSGNILLEVVVHLGAGVEVMAWEEGKEEVTRIEL
jgi:molecular chaperone DnaK (HSP70)